ncbi:MAG: C39 family peptidase [Candidatus Doudnabacteria bacterium]|nr:C39 family peptidase [Candidatus Doudnabacteria bacterium]
MKKIFITIGFVILGALLLFLVSYKNQTDNFSGFLDTSQNQNQTPTYPEQVLISVPFTSQAPFAQWEDDRFQDGCEEAAVIMAVAWTNNQTLTPQGVTDEIIRVSAWENEQYGSYHDTSVEDTVDRIINRYYNYPNVLTSRDSTIDEIKKQLALGKLVIAPIDGTIIGNPNYTQPGPPRHMIVVVGYDEVQQEFITNDPGTRKGENYRYNYETFFNAIRDYPTGHKNPILGIEKKIIIVGKP